MSVTELSEMAQDYLKVIWKAQEWQPTPVTTTEIAEKLGVSVSTVSGNIKKLVAQGLLDHSPYAAIHLSAEGRTAAVQMVRRHRLIETYLVTRVGYGWDEVHDEAENLEHSVSELFLQRIDADLGFPRRDPHGDPIPDAEGRIDCPPAVQLSTLQPGDQGTIARISDDDPDLLRYLDDNQLTLDVGLEVRELKPYAGIISVLRSPSAADGSLELGMTAADAIWLTVSDASPRH